MARPRGRASTKDKVEDSLKATAEAAFEAEDDEDEFGHGRDSTVSFKRMETGSISMAAVDKMIDDEIDRRTSVGFYVTQQYRRFEDDYEVGDLIGQPGQFGMAFSARSKKSARSGGIGEDVVVCVKEIHKAKFHHISPAKRAEILAVLQNEIATLKMVEHDNIVTLYDVYEDRYKLHLVMEYLPGGELFERICEESAFSESQAKEYMRQILSALDHMHSKHILHLDLKPENIIFESKAPDAKIKLIDFGMARVVPRLAKLHGKVGTPAYMAPEIFFGAYGAAADIWSCGIIMFCMLFGFPPFFVDEDDEDEDDFMATLLASPTASDAFDMGGAGASGSTMSAPTSTRHSKRSTIRLSFRGRGTVTSRPGSRSSKSSMLSDDPLERKIMRGFFPEVREGYGAWFPADIPVTPQCRQLITGLLRKDIIRRLTAKEALLSDWINGADSKPVLFTRMVDKLKTFGNECKLRQTISAVFSRKLMDPGQIHALEELFSSIDEDGDGVITLDEFKKSMKEHGSVLADADLSKAFDSLDIDGSGGIEIEEIINAAAYQSMVGRDERMYMIFSKIDKDHSGKISKDEMLKCIEELANETGTKLSADHFAKMTEEWTAAFEEGDTDGDGEIDFEEFLRILHPEFNEGDTLKTFTHASGIMYSGADFRVQRDESALDYHIALPKGAEELLMARAHPVIKLDDCDDVKFVYDGGRATIIPRSILKAWIKTKGPGLISG